MRFLYQFFVLLFIIATLFFLLRVLLFKTGLIHLTKKWWRYVEDFFLVHQSLKVPKFNENLQENPLHRKVSVYLNSLPSLEDSHNTNLFTGKKPSDIILRLDPDQVIEDNFLGARVYWVNEKKNFVLRIRKSDKRRILRPYLQHIHTVAEEVEEKKDLKMYMHTELDHQQDHVNERWRSVPFLHPSTFDSISMESDLKSKVRSDLESFGKAKQYYHRLGRAWKRSYLLYGPSGTGKSSFIAAMANYLSYDVYDIDLSRVLDDSDLKTLLMQTTSKSVVMIEDLDRFLMDKSTGVSLSGVLNFMDGILNGCCAEERIMVFTMNSKDHVDRGILRPGRIDVHIHFPLCDNFSAFKTLASSYLGVKDHKLFPQLEEIFQTGASLSPAEIGELMIANRNSPSRALKSVITALQTEGDGRGGAGNVGRRLWDSGSRKSWDQEATGEAGDHSGIFSSPKDFRKLYGLLRLKSNRKSQSFDMSPGPKAM